MNKLSRAVAIAIAGSLATLPVLSFGMETSPQQTLAFPGAEGFGKYTQGGRGGRVIKVTNLESEGPGSFRDALLQEGPRTVIFEVSGKIDLKGDVAILEPFITIAGQSAPGDGVVITGGSLKIKTSEVIIRNLRVRYGRLSHRAHGKDDAISIVASQDSPIHNVILDHCSATWGTDENIGINGAANAVSHITVQHSILAEGLTGHSMGLLVNGKLEHATQPKYISLYRNLYATNQFRAPAMMGAKVTGEIVENVTYLWKSKASLFLRDSKVNVIGNVFKPGEETKNVYRLFEISTEIQTPYFEDDNDDNPMQLYFSDNVGFDKEGNTLTGEEILSPAEPTTNFDYALEDDLISELSSGLPLTTSDNAFDEVLASAGAFPRTNVTQRIINDVENDKGYFLAREWQRRGDTGTKDGFDLLTDGEVPVDTDVDGLPDAWEDEFGLDRNNSHDANDLTESGYSYLEIYLNNLMLEKMGAL